MSILSIITKLITLGANSSWVDGPLMGIVLKLDGWIYELLSKAFNLFLLMCSVNYSSISGLIAPLIDRIEALILVFVVFKLGVSLISYLLNPDSAAKEGSKIIINIFITAAFLIGYNFVFGVFNELNLLIMGNPTNYPYTTLSSVADMVEVDKDKGLIMRFVFGDTEDVDDIGDFLAFETLSIFVYDWGSPGSQSILTDEICTDGQCDFGRLSSLSGRIGKTLEYHPGGILVGLFLIYSIVKSAIQIGIRMFKLMIMQMIAPIVIVTILSDGIKSEKFQKYVKMYIQVFLEAFIRILSLLVVTVFVCQFFVNSNDFFGNLPSESGWVRFLITILLVAAGYQFAGDLPKFLEDLIGAKMGGDTTKGFQFLGGLIGGGVGGAIGLATGLSSGIHGGAGVVGTLGNTVSGAIGGAAGGVRGKTIADKFKSVGETSKANRERAQRIARQGGGLAYAGQQIGAFFGQGNGPEMNAERLEDTGKAFDDMITARANFMADDKSSYGYGDNRVKWGTDADSFAEQAIEYDENVNKLRDKYEALRASGSSDPEALRTARQEWLTKRDERMSELKNEWHAELFSHSKEVEGRTVSVNDNAMVKETTSNYERRAHDGYSAEDVASGRKSAKDVRKYYAGEAAKQRSRWGRRVQDRQGRYGGGSGN